MKLNNVLRIPSKNGYRVWMITGIYLGSLAEESIVELIALDKDLNLSSSNILVPESMLRLLIEQSIMTICGDTE